MKKFLSELRGARAEIACCLFVLAALVIAVGVGLGSWPKALLFIGAFPVLAIGAFAVIYVGFLLAALIYGGIFYLLLGKNPRYRWWD
ncbi:MAG: hypothetical protein ACPLRH_00075 [Desulfotomaculales bacterium]